jgi:hypothetical protein
LDRTVARLNIEHHRRQLARETDEPRRQVIMRLLAEEKAKLVAPNRSSASGSRTDRAADQGPGECFRIWLLAAASHCRQ